MTLYKEPFMEHIRIDKGISADTEITSSYDPMICKLISWGTDREDARKRMITALSEYEIHGIRTNILFLRGILTNDAFISNIISTKFCDEHSAEIINETIKSKNLIPIQVPLFGYLIQSMGIRNDKEVLNGNNTSIWYTTGFWREQKTIRITSGDNEYQVGILVSKDPEYVLSFENHLFKIKKTYADPSTLSFDLEGVNYTTCFSIDGSEVGMISVEGHIFEMHRQDFLPESISPVRFESSDHNGEVFSPMPGKVIKLFVTAGDKVNKGDVLLIIEAMKMENSIISPTDGIIASVNAGINDRIDVGKVLITFDKNENQEPNKTE